MSVTKTDIGNAALQHLGIKRVANIDPPDNVKSARELADAYDRVRRKLLRNGEWNFAEGIASLAADATSPIFGFTNKFPVPTDFLALREVVELDVDQWKLRGRDIHANAAGPLKIVYTMDVTNTAEFDDSFVEAFGLALALAIVETMTESGTKQDRLFRRLEMELEIALHVDGSENPPEDIDSDTWLLSRL